MYTDITERKLCIFVENNEIGDGHWNITVAQSLREYADMVERKVAGHTTEIYISPNGNKLTIIGGTWLGELLPG